MPKPIQQAVCGIQRSRGIKPSPFSPRKIRLKYSTTSAYSTFSPSLNQAVRKQPVVIPASGIFEILNHVVRDELSGEVPHRFSDRFTIRIRLTSTSTPSMSKTITSGGC